MSVKLFSSTEPWREWTPEHSVDSKDCIYCNAEIAPNILHMSSPLGTRVHWSCFKSAMDSYMNNPFASRPWKDWRPTFMYVQGHNCTSCKSPIKVDDELAMCHMTHDNLYSYMHIQCFTSEVLRRKNGE